CARTFPSYSSSLGGPFDYW
nr:immunoglobulin heavy chain junction region [Macaca mulatta]